MIHIAGVVITDWAYAVLGVFLNATLHKTMIANDEVSDNGIVALYESTPEKRSTRIIITRAGLNTVVTVWLLGYIT